MATLADRFPASWRGRPPAMPAGDFSVWSLFLDGPGRAWREYAYDIELTGAAGPPLAADAIMQATWMRLIAKRVDAIAIRASGLTLMEVRHNAAWQSVGQLIGYRDLFPLDYPTEIVEACAIVTDAIDPQIRAVAERQGLLVMLVT
jgi:hypothetical protein